MTFNNFTNITFNNYLENSFPNIFEEDVFTKNNNNLENDYHEVSDYLTNHFGTQDDTNNNCKLDLEFLDYFSNSNTNSKFSDDQTILQKEISELAKIEDYKKSTDAINKRTISDPSDDDFFTPIIASLPHINQMDRIQILTGKLKNHRIPPDASRE